MTEPQTRRRSSKDEAPPQGDPEPDEEHAGDEPPPAEPAPEPEPAEAQARKLDNAHRKYLADITKIVGDEDMAGMEDCPYCGGFSVVPGEMALQHRGDTEPCDTCNGLGRMVTGSRVPDHAILPCPKCSGSGYQHKVTAQPEAPTAAVRQLPLPAQQVHGWWDPGTQTFHPYGEEAQGS